MVSKAVIKAYASMLKPAKEYRVVGEQEYDHIEEVYTSSTKAIEAALDLIKYEYNVSINEKYLGGNAMAESDYPVNQGYFCKKPAKRRKK